MMTSKDHMTGTDRCAEVLATCNLQVDYVVNIQGDEPFIDPKQIQALISGFSNRPELVTLIKRIADLGTLFNPNSPKVIVDAQKQAIYFSRQTLPYLRSVPQDQWLNKGVFYKHIGLYAYRADVLPTLAKLQPSPLELAESLEQLRWIENGYQIQTVETNIETIGIDTPEDLERIKELGLIS
jgi:3-deoxy-manno-octulosonate cytidylyltransferase (CMP-KDO synthetase)